MYKLKIKFNDAEKMQVYYFDSFEKVFDKLYKIFKCNTLQELNKNKNKMNARVYLSYKKEN